MLICHSLNVKLGQCPKRGVRKNKDYSQPKAERGRPQRKGCSPAHWPDGTGQVTKALMTCGSPFLPTPVYSVPAQPMGQSK